MSPPHSVKKKFGEVSEKFQKTVRLTTPQPQQPANVELHQRNHSALSSSIKYFILLGLTADASFETSYTLALINFYKR